MMAEITAAEASRRHNISIGHLARLARSGTFQKARHFGPMWVFDEDELAEWMQHRPKRGGARPGAGRKQQPAPDADPGPALLAMGASR